MQVLVAQDFLANGSFEEANTCTELNAQCAPEAWFRTPSTDVQINPRVVGKPYAGIHSEFVVIDNIYQPIDRRVFLYTEILCPLIQGNTYTLSFYLNPILLREYTLDVLFLEEKPIVSKNDPREYTPSLTISDSAETWKDMTSQWRKVEIKYTADGTEHYLVLGNMSPDATKADKSQTCNYNGDILFLIDNVTLIPASAAECLCPQYETNKKVLYNKNHRHTDDETEESKYEWIDLLKNPPDGNGRLAPEIPLPKDLVVTFEIPDIAFDFACYDIKEEYAPRLDSLIRLIKDLNPDSLHFIGHTDSIGTEEYNMQLSSRRAHAVFQYINASYLFTTVKVAIIPKGETEPVATNATDAGRMRNRRVEIVVYRK